MAKSLSSIVTDKLLLFNFADVNELWAGKHLNVHVILTKVDHTNCSAGTLQGLLPT